MAANIASRLAVALMSTFEFVACPAEKMLLAMTPMLEIAVLIS